MALIPKIKLCLASNCTTLSFFETTGVYNATTNVGGYGAPNVETSDIDAAVLTVISPSDQTYTIDVFGDFPSDNDEFSIDIDLADLSRTSIEDGYWQFIYTVTTNAAVEYTANTSYYFYCNAECCVSKLLNAIELEDCNCDNINTDRIKTYVKAKTFLASLKNAAKCFNETNFNKIKDILSKICRNSGCKTCN